MAGRVSNMNFRLSTSGGPVSGRLVLLKRAKLGISLLLEIGSSIMQLAGFTLFRLESTGVWSRGKLGASFLILCISCCVVKHPRSVTSSFRAQIRAAVKDWGPGAFVVSLGPVAARYSNDRVEGDRMPKLPA